MKFKIARSVGLACAETAGKKADLLGNLAGRLIVVEFADEILS